MATTETIHITYEGIPLADVDTDTVPTGVDAAEGTILTGVRPTDREGLLRHLLDYANLIRWDEWLRLYDIYLHPAVEMDRNSCMSDLLDCPAGRVNVACSMIEPIRIPMQYRDLADKFDRMGRHDLADSLESTVPIDCEVTQIIVDPVTLQRIEVHNRRLGDFQNEKR